MKLKYKKMVLLITMCTMGIGLVTFSLSRPKDKATTAVEETQGDAVTFNANATNESDTQKSLAAAEITTTVTPEPTEVPQVETATTADLAGDLEKNAYDDINKLIKKYFKAKLSNDADKYKSLVNDTKALDLKDIERQTKYIEKYENINCFTKKGPEEGSYIVYAYHEVKFSSIETLAPGLNVFYLKTNEEGKPYIYLGEIEKETDQYMNDVQESEDVMDLIYSVNEKLQKAVEDDGALAEFYLKLEESAKDVTKNE
jgi:hypothetical protein